MIPLLVHVEIFKATFIVMKPSLFIYINPFVSGAEWFRNGFPLILTIAHEVTDIGLLKC